MSEITSQLSIALADRYRIGRHLGEGGMATVYLAEDLKHKRNVAVKVLRPELAAVLGAERFVQEITTTANLQHPNILPLFDSGEADGFLYYVMPYIEGETLREKLNRDTQLGLDEAVNIAVEVAQALDSAHRQGVIHRDIKPENILMHDGRPMVADFGIALAVSAAAGGRMTETGLSLGTPHYMSPEQATAEKEITARSDVYSLGSVLYELLSGQPPHLGGSAQQIIMKIITEPPAAITALRKSVTPNVAAALDKALEKLPADRFESARAFADALEDPGYTQGTTTAHASIPAARPSFAIWVTATIALATLVVGYGLGSIATSPSDMRPVQFYPDIPDSITQVATCCGPSLALSPDGRTLVFVGTTGSSGALYRRSMDRLGAEVIPGTEGGSSPFFSPDGQWLAFEAQGQMKKVRIAGGPVVPIAETGAVSGATWTERDIVVYADITRGNELWLVGAGGGTPVPLTGPDSLPRAGLPYPVALPGGTAVLSSHGSGSLESRRIVVVDLETADVDTIGFGTNAEYADGHLLIAGADGTLTTQPFDPVRHRTTGDPIVILSGLVRQGPWRHAFTVTSSGWLAYEPGSAPTEPTLRVAPFSPTLGTAEGTNQALEEARDLSLPGSISGSVSGAALSPDGQRIVLRLQRGSPGDPQDLWMFDPETVTLTRFTTGGTSSPLWTPDGKQIAYRSNGDGNLPAGIHLRNADLSGPPELILTGDRLVPQSWTPDGHRLLFGVSHAQTQRDIGIITLGEAEPEWIIRSDAEESEAQVSPDGRRLAYNLDGNIWVGPMSDIGGAVQVSDGLSAAPRWSRDGRTLYYLSFPDYAVVGASLAPGAGIMVTDRTTITKETSSILQLGPGSTHWDLFPDGRRILFINVARGDSRPRIGVVQNWQSLVREMSPSQR